MFCGLYTCFWFFLDFQCVCVCVWLLWLRGCPLHIALGLGQVREGKEGRLGGLEGAGDVEGMSLGGKL